MIRTLHPTLPRSIIIKLSALSHDTVYRKATAIRRCQQAGCFVQVRVMRVRPCARILKVVDLTTQGSTGYRHATTMSIALCTRARGKHLHSAYGSILCQWPPKTAAS